MAPLACIFACGSQVVAVSGELQYKADVNRCHEHQLMAQALAWAL